MGMVGERRDVAEDANKAHCGEGGVRASIDDEVGNSVVLTIKIALERTRGEDGCAIRQSAERTGVNVIRHNVIGGIITGCRRIVGGINEIFEFGSVGDLVRTSLCPRAGETAGEGWHGGMSIVIELELGETEDTSGDDDEGHDGGEEAGEFEVGVRVRGEG